MTTPNTRNSHFVSRTVRTIPQVFTGFLFPVIFGSLKISGALLRSTFWLFVTITSYLLKSLHAVFESMSQTSANQNQ